MPTELRAPGNAREWDAYHTIRRRVLFELRGAGDAYDANHPDERRAGNYPLMLLDNDVPVGVIRIDVTGDLATFRRVAIREDLQRRGYGRALLEAAEQFARDRGCSRVESHVDNDAVTFYERSGYVRVDEPSRSSSTLVTKSLLLPT